jgi:hypothetical protein
MLAGAACVIYKVADELLSKWAAAGKLWSCFTWARNTIKYWAKKQ